MSMYPFRHYHVTGGSARSTDARFDELLRIMRTERPYLNGQLMQQDIANRLGISNRTLTRLIDRYTEDNFCGFINDFRLREAIRLLKDRQCDRLSIEQIGRQAGFNTRSVFHRVFREKLGCSPAQYRARLR